MEAIMLDFAELTMDRHLRIVRRLYVLNRGQAAIVWVGLLLYLQKRITTSFSVHHWFTVLSAIIY